MPFIVAIRTAESWTLTNVIAAAFLLDLVIVVVLVLIIRRRS